MPDSEDDTALSIIDPVTVGVELGAGGVLEIQIQHRLNVRLSYHDVRMLTEMAVAVPKQLGDVSRRNSVADTPTGPVAKLATLGFTIEDCQRALDECNDDIEEAALWLTHNANHHSFDGNGQTETRKSSWHSLVIRANCLVLTVIDDCGDADVPLAEVCLSDVTASQIRPEEVRLGGNSAQEGGVSSVEGELECCVSCDYYNRALSGWEPCIEPWKCTVAWESSTRLFVDVASASLLDINVTSALLELYRLVSDSWSNDMRRSSSAADMKTRRRRRFVPFALKNETGSILKFATVTSRLEDEDVEGVVDTSSLDDSGNNNNYSLDFDDASWR